MLLGGRCPGAPPPPISGRAGGQGLAGGTPRRPAEQAAPDGDAEGWRLAALAARLRREGLLVGPGAPGAPGQRPGRSLGSRLYVAGAWAASRAAEQRRSDPPPRRP